MSPAPVARILLARHGQTIWNVEEIFRGRADIELNEIGIRQAELLAGFLSYPLQAVCSSPLKRALKTAEIIAAKSGNTVAVCPELIDMDFGRWEGMPVSAVKEKYPADFELWANHPEKVRFPAGESLEDVRRRALALLDKILKPGTGNVLLVSHRVVHKVLILALLGLDVSRFWNIRLDTCGLTTFSWHNDRFVLVEHNNTSFLRPIEKESAGKDF